MRGVARYSRKGIMPSDEKSVVDVLKEMQDAGFSITLLWINDTYFRRTWRVRITDAKAQPEDWWLGEDMDFEPAVKKAYQQMKAVRP